MSVIDRPCALSKRLCARARARGEGAWWRVCSKSSCCGAVSGVTYLMRRTSTFSGDDDTKGEQPVYAPVYHKTFGCLLIPYATAYRGLFQRAGAAPGEIVFVHGASGGVGIAGVQLARAAGLQVIGSAGTEKGLRLVAEQGAHHVLDHGTSDYLEQVRTLTDGRGADIILEILSPLR